MDIPVFEIIVLVVLTGINAFFTGSEIAFVSLRDGQLQGLAEQGRRGRRIVALARNPTQFLAACQVGITLAGFFASATAAVSLSQPVEDLLDFLGGAAHPVAFVLVTVVLAYFTLVFGELAPKRIAMQRSESWAKFVINVIQLIAQITRPIIWVLERSTNLVVRLLGADPSMQREEVSEDEIRGLLQSQKGFSPEQRSIIEGAFEISERTLREIVVPRGLVTAVPHTADTHSAASILAQSGHSRAPVHTGDLDDVLGIVHIRDLINVEVPVVDHVRPATVLPESLNVLDALRRLQSTHQQMAIVVNEHGGVEGIITVEDLLEEIVGEIYDEFDKQVAAAEPEADGSLVIPGSFPIHDLDDLNVELPDGEGSYSTVAGYVLDQLGHIPEIGEVVVGEHWRVEVLEVLDRAITSVRLVKVPQAPESD